MDFHVCHLNYRQIKQPAIGLLLCLLSFICFGQSGQKITNPVLPGVADAGVLKYNGEYYIGGVFTDGGFYHSSDLVNWEGPVHVFSMDNDWTSGKAAEDRQIHANDINYINGTFHQYWSVNHWGEDSHAVHIGHATADNILGPYTEPDKEQWLDNRIDPALFKDDDGQLYLYMVKFTDGNTIWGRKMKDAYQFAEAPQYLFASLPGTWETMDNRVAEGPWVIKYRDQYYMMYNANHTAPRWGNYMLGVAQADSPLGFNHGNKYNHPVVKSNQDDMEDLNINLLSPSVSLSPWHYVLASPPKKWYRRDFDASAWQEGRGAFGSAIVKNSTTRNVKTKWNSEAIWLRKDFQLDEEMPTKFRFRLHHDGPITLYLNGTQIYEHKTGQFANWTLDENGIKLLSRGKNTLAVHAQKGARESFVDLALFDIKCETDEDILYSPGQPNIIRGPNGFEWWLVYMGNKNRDRRGQYIDRVHFHGKKLTVEGMTAENTPGYHPVPAMPTFSALFNDAHDLQQKWTFKSGDWRIADKALQQIGTRVSEATINSKAAQNYRIEASLKMSATGKAGLIAWQQDDENRLIVYFDAAAHSWAWNLIVDGQERSGMFLLEEAFNFQVYHSITIHKNAGNFSIYIDELPAPGQSLVVAEKPAKAGLPGLFTQDTEASFDGISYTIGWDEFNKNMPGWFTGENPLASENYDISKEGIHLQSDQKEQRLLKGDALEAYEFNVQISLEDDVSAGIYPMFINADNFIKISIDKSQHMLSISGKENGKSTVAQEIQLSNELPHYVDMKYSDFIEKQYAFDTPLLINGFRMHKVPHGQKDTIIDDISEKMTAYYKIKDRWLPLKQIQRKAGFHPAFDAVTFEAVKAEGLRFVNKDPSDQNHYVYKLWVSELSRVVYNLRIIRQGNELIVWLNGKEVATVKHALPPSKVGLFTTRGSARFNDIICFDRGL